MTKSIKWVCAQQRLRSAWASAQSHQSLLCTHWIAKDPRFHHVDSENSDQAQADLSIRSAHTHFVGFVMLWLMFSLARESAISLSGFWIDRAKWRPHGGFSFTIASRGTATVFLTKKKQSYSASVYLNFTVLLTQNTCSPNCNKPEHGKIWIIKLTPTTWPIYWIISAIFFISLIQTDSKLSSFNFTTNRLSY